MRFLADVNVVFPLLVSRHEHRERALAWFDAAESGEVALARIVRLGVLRLLCNTAVMGADVLSPRSAWEAVSILEADERIVLLHEPDGLDEVLRDLVRSRKSAPNLWTDAYLAAFAAVAGLSVVSFDRDFSKFDGVKHLLPGER